MNIYDTVRRTEVVNAEPVYGYPIEDDQYPDCYPLETQGYVVTSAAVACLSADVEEIQPFPIAYDSESDFFEGIIEILADTDTDKNVAIASSLSPMAFPVGSEANQDVFFSPGRPVYSAYSCYAVPEATRIDEDEEEKKLYENFDFPIAAFESMEMSDTPPPTEENKPTNGELFCVGTIDIDYLRSLHDAEEKRQRRKEAIDRWKVKKLKKKSVIKAVKHSVNTFSEGAAAACNTILNARQKATAKRERENGKFKKAQVKWVSVTDLFNSFDELK
jgi:hypothetical protein